MVRQDRRIRRTRKLLHTALVELIAEKEYNEITIQELTERADIGHRTFYRHYADKDDLLLDVMKDTLSGLQNLLVLPSSAIFPDDPSDSTPRENGRRLFAYVEEHEAFFRVLFQERLIIDQSMVDLARQRTITLLQNLKDERYSPIPYRIMANHVMTSTIEMMKLWLEDGKPYSAEVMGEYLVQLVFKPIRNLLSEKAI